MTNSRNWVHAGANWTAIAVAVALVACSSDDTPGDPTPTPTQDAAAEVSEEAAAQEAAAEAEAAAEEAAVEAGPDAELACEPHSVEGWTPTWHPPTGMYQARCAAGEVAAILEDCLGATATQAKCTAATSKYPTCVDCLFTEDSEASWGPVVHFGELNFYDRNDSGCFALLSGDATATGCGAKVQAYYECGQKSCSPGCEIITNADFEAFNQCTQAASSDPNYCLEESEAKDPCWQQQGYSICKWKLNEGWTKVAERIGELFCGSAPADGGTDGGEADAEPAGDAAQD